MPQQIENTPQSSAGKAIGDIISALKTSIGIGGSENKMFSNLLAEAGQSLPKVEPRQSVADAPKKEEPKAREAKEVKADKDDKPHVQKEDQQRDSKKVEHAKAVDGQSLKAEKEEGLDVTEEALKVLESQMALAADSSENSNGLDAHDALSKDSKMSEDISYEDVMNFLSGALVDNKTNKVDAQVQAVIAKLEEVKPEDGEDPLEALGQALQAIELQLKQQQDLSAKAGKTDQTKEALAKADSAGLSEALAKADSAGLSDALAQIAEKLSLLKESRDGAAKDVDAKLQSLMTSDTEGGEEGLWQKMVQDLRDESLGRKNGTAHNLDTTQFVENDKGQALKANGANSFGQAVAAMAQANKPAPESFSKNTAAPAPSQTIIGTGAEAGRPVGSYDFASQLSAARETKGGATGLPKVIEQVSVQLHKAVKDGKTEMTLNLKPAELGRVEVKLIFGEGKSVTGVVIAETQASLNMLQKDADGLVRALQDAGLNADMASMEFSLKDDGQSSAHAQNQQQGDGKGHKKFSVVQGGKDEDGTLSDAAADMYYLEPGRVNLQV